MNVLDLVELRKRGFSEADFTDEELRNAEANTWRLIELFINRKLDVTTELRLDGEDSQVLPLPTQIISLDSVTVEYSTDDSEEVDVDEIAVYNRNVPNDFYEPKIVWRDGKFPQGFQNIVLSGQFGYVEGDLDIQPLMEVCARLLYLQFRPLIDGATSSAEPYMSPEDIKREVTDRYEYEKYDRDTLPGIFNDSLVNAILLKYHRGTDVISLGWV